MSVALVSRNPAIALAVAAADDNVTEIPPTTLGAWLEADHDLDHDALVLDLGSVQTVLKIVGDLRKRDRWIPVVVIASASADTQLASLPRTRVIGPPIDAAHLRAALDGAAALPAIREVADTHIPLTAAAPATQPDTEPAVEPVVEPVDDIPEVQEPAWLAEEIEASLQPTPTTAEVPEAEPTVIDLRRSAALHIPSTPRDDHDLRRLLLAADEAPPVATPTGSTTTATTTMPVSAVVETLLAERTQLFGVSDASEAVVAGAVALVPADGAALLVPDGDVWRVAAGHNLRPLETRYQLESNDWLVEHVAHAHKGVIVEESDGARHALRGAPLSSRRHLLAVPVPDVHAILLMARDEDPPFDEAVLGSLAELAREATPLLTEAMHTRELARSLADLQDLD